MSDKKTVNGVETTGHVWDETLAELTNEPPKWWMLGLWAGIIFVIGYWILYPAIPLVNGYTKGVLGWTAIKEYKQDLATLDEMRAKYETQIPSKSVAEILADDELSTYVVRSAKVLFGDNCAACHGTAGVGNSNYPVLVDNVWMYGGTIDTIHQTITNGRKPMMPKMGMGGQVLTDAEINTLATAIHSGTVASEPLYMSKGCVGCHTPTATGMQVLGSANLVDKVWRFKAEDQLASIKYTITHGVNDPTDPQTRHAEMPKFGGAKLSETDIKKLAVYVHKLGGGV